MDDHAARMLRLMLRMSLTVIAVAWPASLAAQAETPEDVARQYFVAMRSEDAAALARVTHPAALAELRDLLAPLFASTLPEADEFRQRLLGVRTVPEARALSDTTVFANFIRALGGQLPIFTEALRSSSMEPVGHVIEGSDTAHVVYRVMIPLEGITLERMAVLSLGRQGETWRALLSGDYSELARVLRETLGG
jgi:hypothetical protein